jgi:ribosomal protein S18 acetylase RimI-like enzyme
MALVSTSIRSRSETCELERALVSSVWLAFLPVTVRIEAAAEASSELRSALAALLPQLNPSLRVPTLDHLKAMVADPAVRLLVARDGSEIVGMAAVVVYVTPIWVKARIEDVVVDQAARGRGVGEALVKACLEVARHRGAAIVELQSARSREAANRLYPRLGFELRESNLYRLNLR